MKTKQLDTVFISAHPASQLKFSIMEFYNDKLHPVLFLGDMWYFHLFYKYFIY